MSIASPGTVTSSGAVDAVGLIPYKRWDVESQAGLQDRAADAVRYCWGRAEKKIKSPSVLSLLEVLRPIFSLCNFHHRFGAFLPSVENFDSSAFGINEHEAALMDPQQRMLLTAAMEACVEVGSGSIDDGSRLAGILRRDWGVYVGASALDYSRVAARWVWSAIFNP